MGFINSLQKGVQRFIDTDCTVVRILSNLSVDGIASSSILVKAFQRNNIKFVLSFTTHLNDELLSDMHREDYNVIFFLDIGASSLQSIEQKLSNKTLFVFDHHQPQKFEEQQHILHLNPYLFGLNGTTDISTAGISYFFAKTLNPLNEDLFHLALIGAIGDHQDTEGLHHFNKTILDDAVTQGNIIITETLKLDNIRIQPIHKVLEHSVKPYIPGVTGSEYGALRFLEQQHISPKLGDAYKTFQDFNEEDIKKVIAGLILTNGTGIKKPEDIYGITYLLHQQKTHQQLADLNDMCSIINSCVILGKPTLGIGVCLNNQKLTDAAIQFHLESKKEIIEALNWFYRNKNTDRVTEKNNLVLIQGGESIKDTIMSTLIDIISESNTYPHGTIIIGTAHTLDNFINVNARICGDTSTTIMPFIKELTSLSNATKISSYNSASFSIPQEKEESFLKALNNVLTLPTPQ